MTQTDIAERTAQAKQDLADFEARLKHTNQGDPMTDHEKFTPIAIIYPLGRWGVPMHCLWLQEAIENCMVGYKAYGNYTAWIDGDFVVQFFPNHAIASIEYPPQPEEHVDPLDEPAIPVRHEGSE